MERYRWLVLWPLAVLAACGPQAQGFQTLATPATVVWDSTLVGEWLYDLSTSDGAGIVSIAEGDDAEYDIYLFNRKGSARGSLTLVQLGRERYLDLEGPLSKPNDFDGKLLPTHTYYRLLGVTGDTLRAISLDGWPKSWRLGAGDSLTPGSSPRRVKGGQWTGSGSSNEQVHLTFSTARLQVEIPKAFHAADAKLDTISIIRIMGPDAMKTSH